MKTKFLSLLLAILCYLPAQAQMSAYLADTLSALFHQRADLLRMKGIGAAVVFPDGSVWTDVHGNYGTKALTPDLLFEIGSNTKSMTAAAILLLAEEGKLSLEDTIGQYLGPINHLRGDVTIRQLLDHTSGMYSFTGHPDFFPFVNNNWNAFIPSDSILPKYLLQPDFEPGTSWNYSNSGYIAAGLIIEKVSGIPYHQFLKDKIFDRLGLADTYTAFYDVYGAHHVGTWMTDGSFEPQPSKSFLTAAWAAGGVIATPADFARWCHLLFGERLLKAQSYKEMTTTQKVSNGWNYGLGIMKRDYKGREYYGHGGTTLQHSAMEYSIESDFSVATIGIEDGQFNQPIQMANFLIDLMESELPNVPLTYLGEEEVSKRIDFAIQVYPNPATDYLVIETSRQMSTQVDVFNSSGQLVFQGSTKTGMLQIQQKEIGAGLYTATVRNEESGEVVHQRFLFQ